MGLLRRIAGLLGLGKEEEVVKDQHDSTDDHNNNAQTYQYPSNFQQTPKPFARPYTGPVLAPSSSRDGGVQGLGWYAKRLRIDEDGDVADEFLDEVMPDTSSSVGDQQKPMRFEVKYKTRPAKIRNQVMSHDGRIQHGVEYQGRLQWV